MRRARRAPTAPSSPGRRPERAAAIAARRPCQGAYAAPVRRPRGPRRRAAAARAARPAPRAWGPSGRCPAAPRSERSPNSFRNWVVRAVEDRAELRVAGLLDQAPLEQRGGRRVGADAADARDLGARDRLQVGDDRERLGLGGRQRGGARAAEQAARGLLGLGVAGERPAAGQLAQRYARAARARTARPAARAPPARRPRPPARRRPARHG